MKRYIWVAFNFFYVLSHYEIIKLNNCDWPLFREIRLQALKELPYAYTTLYEEEVEAPESEWLRLLPAMFFC